MWQSGQLRPGMMIAPEGASESSLIGEWMERNAAETQSTPTHRPPRSAGSHAPALPLGVLGWGGAAAVLLGAFLPGMSVPVVGGLSFVQAGETSGGSTNALLLFAAASVAALSLVVRRFFALWVSGLAAAGVAVVFAFNFMSQVGGQKQKMAEELAGNPFAGLAEMALASVKLEYGLGVILAGTALMVAEAILAARRGAGTWA